MSPRSLLAPALLAALLAGGGANAFTLQEFSFDTPAQEQAFRDLTGKLRCLVCQNESLAASQSDLAQDLRREVYAMMRAGKSQDEITRFLVDRYGDFVLYQPPVKPSTYLLWFGPFILIGVGAVLLLRTLRRRESGPEQTLSPDDQTRIEEILAAAEAPKEATK
jgi:cytochrome c-type biogenesis protein CcmH